MTYLSHHDVLHAVSLSNSSHLEFFRSEKKLKAKPIDTCYILHDDMLQVNTVYC